ncbi:hypothetical protein J9332_43340, partial [Aquimarina celericrescens]|nr:hypothetical protein [Aquimarina celericrescens]
MTSGGGIINVSDGSPITEDIEFNIVRSGYRNQQMANMASITMMKNPILDASGNKLNSINTDTFKVQNTTTTANNVRVVNASAV